MIKTIRLNFFYTLLYTSLLTTATNSMLYAMENKADEDISAALPSSRERSTNTSSSEQERQRERYVHELTSTLLFGGGGSDFQQISGDWGMRQLALSSLLRSVRRYDERIGERLQQAKTRRHNKKLKEKNKTKTGNFSTALKSAGMDESRMQGLSAMVYGLQKLSTNYLTSTINKLKEEKENIDKGLLTKDGYASHFINPQDERARRRFVKDLIDIFEYSKKHTEFSVTNNAKLNLTNFSMFAELYLSLIHETLGNIGVFNYAVGYTSQDRYDDKKLTEEDLWIRIFVLKLHYLGDVERSLEIIEKLQPIASIASQIDKEIFDLDKLNDYHLSYIKEFLNVELPKKSDSSETAEFSVSIPEELPEKPLTRNQKKKRAQRAKRKANMEKLADTLQKKAQEQTVNISPKNAHTTVSEKKEFKSPFENSSESFESWFYKSENLKRDFRATLDQDLRKKRKTEAKKLKKGAADRTGKIVKEEEKEKEKEEVKENIKKVVHKPHKKGSKKLGPEHVNDIRQVLLDGGYAPDTVKKRGNKDSEIKVELGGKPWKVFNDILDESYSGEMEEVTNMLRALGGFVDETRSGSRIGIALRHITSNEVVGTNILSLERGD